MPLASFPASESVLAVPFVAHRAGVPQGGEAQRFWRGGLERSGSNALEGVLALMLAPVDSLKIGEVIVECVAVQVVNVEAFWNRPAMVFVNRPVKV